MTNSFKRLRRPLLFCLTLFLALPNLVVSQNDLNEFFDRCDHFMSRYVSEDGFVDYAAIKWSDADLESMTLFVEQTNSYDYAGNDLKAYWINAYNMIVVREVIRNYPMRSVQDVVGFFSNKQHQMGAKKFTLDQIENELLRKEFEDARIHFALNCGALSCPKLLNEAYRPEKLDQQLEAQTKRAVNDPYFVEPDSTGSSVEVSKIFFWFKEDFAPAGGTVEFINRYLDTPVSASADVDSKDYDWLLNDKALQEGTQIKNLQAFTPSALFDKGQWEFKTFFNLYTQNAIFANFQKTEVARSTFFTSIHQFLIGVSPRINVGGEFWAKSVLSGGPRGNNPLNIFLFPKGSGFLFKPIYLGPKVKVAPFKSLPRLSFQSTFLYPIANDYEGRERTDINAFLFLEFDRYLSINDIYFDKSLNKRLQVFVRTSGWVSIPRNSFRNNAWLETPISGFLSFFPNPRVTIYAQTEYWAKHTEDGTNGDNSFKAFNSFFVQSGLGGKYQLIPGRLELEALYTNFWLGSDFEGAGQTFNFGFRIIR